MSPSKAGDGVAGVLGRPMLLLTAAAAVVGASAMAGVLSVLALGCVAVALVAIAISRPVVAAALMVAASYSNAASVLEEYHGVPLLGEALLGLMVIALVVHRLRSPPAEPTAAPTVVVLFGLYIAVAAVSVLWALDRPSALGAIDEAARDVLVVILVVSCVRTVRDYRALVLTLIGTGLLLGAINVHKFLAQSFVGDYGGFGQASVEQIVGALDDWRIRGPFDDPNFFAQAMLITFALGLGRFLAGRVTSERVVGLVAAGCAAVAVVVSYSRGGVVGLVCIAALMTWVHRPRPAMLAAAVALVLAVVVLLPAGYRDRLDTTTAALPVIGDDSASVDPSLRGRTSELVVGIEMFRDHPLGGVGIANYPVHYQEYSRELGIDPRREEREAHNFLIEIGAETGLLGLATFGAILVGVALSVAEARRSEDEELRWLVTDVGIALGGYLVAGLFLHMAYERTLWILIGLGLAAASVARSSDVRAEPAERALTR